MGQLNVRMRDEEVSWIKETAREQGITQAELIRRALGLYAENPLEERLEDHERRLARLEEAAGP